MIVMIGYGCSDDEKKRSLAGLRPRRARNVKDGESPAEGPHTVETPWTVLFGTGTLPHAGKHGLIQAFSRFLRPKGELG